MIHAVTAVALSAVTSTPCTAAVREWEYTYPWVCCVALPCLFVCLFDLACFFLSSFSSLI